MSDITCESGRLYRWYNHARKWNVTKCVNFALQVFSVACTVHRIVETYQYLSVSSRFESLKNNRSQCRIAYRWKNVAKLTLLFTVEQEYPDKRDQVPSQFCFMEDGATYSQLVEGALSNLLYLFLSYLFIITSSKDMLELNTVFQWPFRNLTLQKLFLIFLRIDWQLAHSVYCHYWYHSSLLFNRATNRFMALEYLWCYQVEKESYLSKLVESNNEITSSKGACSCFIFSWVKLY